MAMTPKQLAKILEDNPDKDIVILDGIKKAKIDEVWSNKSTIYITFIEGK